MSVVAKRLDGLKVPFGMEVGLGSGDFVLDGYPAPAQNTGHIPTFRPCLLSPYGWMIQDST